MNTVCVSGVKWGARIEINTEYTENQGVVLLQELALINLREENDKLRARAASERNAREAHEMEVADIEEEIEYSEYRLAADEARIKALEATITKMEEEFQARLEGTWIPISV